jgi:D-arabinose 1-dehydrogenase-like Zn-dependent alcohol dehydrogenase
MSWSVEHQSSTQEQVTDGGAQLKVKACGVCGTDLHIHEGEFLAKVRTKYQNGWPK